MEFERQLWGFVRTLGSDYRNPELSHHLRPKIGWMRGWMDGWMDGWRDGWIEGWMDE